MILNKNIIDDRKESNTLKAKQVAQWTYEHVANIVNYRKHILRMTICEYKMCSVMN